MGPPLASRVQRVHGHALWANGGARLTPQVGTPQGETTHYILCVAVLLQNVFAVHRLSAAGCVEGPRKKVLKIDTRCAGEGS